ncbi:MAG: phenylacetic acid degradation operon negative regulatory protein PaaX [Actinomycetota bacterium]
MPQGNSDIVARLTDRLRPKAKSLIITVYGDAIAHHGGNAWLGSLIELVEPLGMNERMVRTSVFRLAKEGWLVAQPIGRRSYYRLTEAGQRRFDAAHIRIYRHAQRPWDKGWTVVVPVASLGPEARDTLRRDLGWLGFGLLPGGVMLHPDPDEAALRALLDGGPGPAAMVVRGAAPPWGGSDAVAEVIRGCWDLGRLAEDYAGFLDTFRPVWQALKDAPALDPRLCFCVRTLLMHGYRRALLRDPMLPDELLPGDWPGAAARVLCRNLYRLTEAAAERHVEATLETPDGPVPGATAAYFTRFGGLRGQVEEAAASAI